MMHGVSNQRICVKNELQQQGQRFADLKERKGEREKGEGNDK